jgi:hypothetical protein
MTNSTKTIRTLIALAALAISGLAAAADPTLAYHVGVENRAGLVGIPVCAKADKEAGTKYIYTDDLHLRAALAKAATSGCFERLGREGDDGYAATGVSLIAIGGNVYKSAVDGKPAGPALRALTAPKVTLANPDATELAGVVTMSMYSPSGRVTINVVSFPDGTRAIVKRSGQTLQLPVGEHVKVAFEKLEGDNYWLTIPGRVL